MPVANVEKVKKRKDEMSLSGHGSNHSGRRSQSFVSETSDFPPTPKSPRRRLKTEQSTNSMYSNIPPPPPPPESGSPRTIRKIPSLDSQRSRSPLRNSSDHSTRRVPRFASPQSLEPIGEKRRRKKSPKPGHRSFDESQQTPRSPGRSVGSSRKLHGDGSSRNLPVNPPLSSPTFGGVNRSPKASAKKSSPRSGRKSLSSTAGTPSIRSIPAPPPLFDPSSPTPSSRKSPRASVKSVGGSIPPPPPPPRVIYQRSNSMGRMMPPSASTTPTTRTSKTLSRDNQRTMSFERAGSHRTLRTMSTPTPRNNNNGVPTTIGGSNHDAASAISEISSPYLLPTPTRSISKRVTPDGKTVIVVNSEEEANNILLSKNQKKPSSVVRLSTSNKNKSTRSGKKLVGSSKQNASVSGRSRGGGGSMGVGGDTNNNGEKPRRTMAIIWALMAAELGFDLGTNVIAFINFLNVQTCCGYEIELGPLTLWSTIPFFCLVVIEMVFLFRAISLTVWPPPRVDEDQDDNNAGSWRSSWIVSVCCCCLKWNARMLMRLVHICTILNPFLSCFVAWVLMYEANRLEAFVVLGLEGASIILHMLSVYLDGSLKDLRFFILHSLPIIPFIVTVSLMLVYLKQGGVCYIVEKDLFLFTGCEVCDDGMPPIDGYCGNVTFSGGNLLDTIVEAEDFGDLTVRASQADYCAEAGDPVQANFCFFPY